MTARISLHHMYPLTILSSKRFQPVSTVTQILFIRRGHCIQLREEAIAMPTWSTLYSGFANSMTTLRLTWTVELKWRELVNCLSSSSWFNSYDHTRKQNKQNTLGSSWWALRESNVCYGWTALPPWTRIPKSLLLPCPIESHGQMHSELRSIEACALRPLREPRTQAWSTIAKERQQYI